MAGRADGGAMKDEESGEILLEEVVALRRNPQRSSYLPGDDLDRVAERERSRRHSRALRIFRIKDALLESDLRLREGIRTSRGGRSDPHRSWCAHCSQGDPQAVWSEYYGPVQADSIRRSTLFRIPTKYLTNIHAADPRKDSSIITVSIWQEFLHGTSVLEQYRSPEDKYEHNLYNSILHHLHRYLPYGCVAFLSWVFFLFMYFGVCCNCTVILELACWLKFMAHLEIHQQAYKSKLNVIFNGTAFQGPCYILLRWHCEHCTQKEREKVVNNLMKKMKMDILGSSSPT